MLLRHLTLRYFLAPLGSASLDAIELAGLTRAYLSAMVLPRSCRSDMVCSGLGRASLTDFAWAGLAGAYQSGTHCQRFPFLLMAYDSSTKTTFQHIHQRKLSPYGHMESLVGVSRVSHRTRSVET